MKSCVARNEPTREANAVDALAFDSRFHLFQKTPQQLRRFNNEPKRFVSAFLATAVALGS
jgi:hypothetical protein